jgi:hypothetical protein
MAVRGYLVYAVFVRVHRYVGPSGGELFWSFAVLGCYVSCFARICKNNWQVIATDGGERATIMKSFAQ